MDGDNSKAKPSRCWGVTDLDEDVDAYNVYQIPKDKIESTSSNKTVGYNKTNELVNPVTEKKKKSKGKNKQVVITTNDETKRQLPPSFGGNPDVLNGNISKPNQETAAIQLPKQKSNEDSINKASEIESISSNFLNPSIYPPNIYTNRSPVFPIRPSNDMNQNLYSYGFNSRVNPPFQFPQTLYYPQRIYQPPNNLLPVSNLSNYTMGNTVQRMINCQQQNTVTKASYYERLEVIDVLFRFIIQILRTPEQPSVEQIEDIKRMLDSLIKNNDANMS